MLFLLYCLMMLWLLLLRRIPAGAGMVQLNLQPLDTIKRYLWVLRYSTEPIQRRYAVANLLGNVGLFLPLGMFLPILFEKTKKPGRFLLCAVTTILMVELCQMLTGLGACDVDDLILNTIGAVAGWGLWKSIQILNGKKTEEST